MYPLSGQSAVDNSEMPETVVYSDDGSLPPQPMYSAPLAEERVPANRPDGRPMTFAERRMARGSPYDPILRGTTYGYPVSAPTYVPPPEPTPYSSMPSPSATYSPAPLPVQSSPMVAEYPGQVITTPGSSTVIRGDTVILPDPPMIVRDASGRVETYGMPASTTVPLVRVPAQYAPSAPGALVEAAPPINPQIVSVPQQPVQPPMPSGAPYYAAPATYAASALRLVPADDIPPTQRANDYAPSQWYEIIRPDNGPIRIGRVSSTCVCVNVRVPNRFVAAGERALVEARTVSRPSVNGVTYGIYVGVLEPVSTTLDADIVVGVRR